MNGSLSTQARAVSVIITDPSYVKTRTDYEETIVPEQAGCSQEDRPGTHVILPLAASLWARLPTPSHSNASLAPSEEDGEEMLLVIGERRPLSEYRYLGSHTTDSGLVCLIKTNPYEGHEEVAAGGSNSEESKGQMSDVSGGEEGEQVPMEATSRGDEKVSGREKAALSTSAADLELDWLELVTASLEGGTIDLDQFPLLKFCAAVPEGESAVAVYGCTTSSSTTDGSDGAAERAANADRYGYTGLVLRTWTRVFDQHS